MPEAHGAGKISKGSEKMIRIYNDGKRDYVFRLDADGVCMVDAATAKELLGSKACGLYHLARLRQTDEGQIVKVREGKSHHVSYRLDFLAEMAKRMRSPAARRFGEWYTSKEDGGHPAVRSAERTLRDAERLADENAGLRRSCSSLTGIVRDLCDAAGVLTPREIRKFAELVRQAVLGGERDLTTMLAFLSMRQDIHRRREEKGGI